MVMLKLIILFHYGLYSFVKNMNNDCLNEKISWYLFFISSSNFNLFKLKYVPEEHFGEN